MPLPPEQLAQAQQEAISELSNEDFRAAVEKHKAWLRERRLRPWWVKLFPWRIVIIRKDQL